MYMIAARVGWAGKRLLFKMANILFSAMKNEAPFLLEWVAYHKAIGFDQIVVVSNDSVDATDDLLRALSERGEVKAIRQDVPADRSAQENATRLVAEMGILKEGDWGIFLDADEFLNIHIGGGTVGDLAHHLRTQDRIGMLINWRVFGDSGNLVFNGRYVSGDYTQCDAGLERTQFKTFFQKNKETRGFSQFLHLCDLEPVTSRLDRFSTPTGEALSLDDANVNDRQRNWLKRWVQTGQSPMGGFFGRVDRYEIAQINHYMVRDPHSFSLKAKRGRGYKKSSDRHTQDFYKKWNLNEAKDTSILRWEDQTRQEMDRLTKACGLRELRAQIRADYLSVWQPPDQQKPIHYSRDVLKIIRDNGLHGVDLDPPPGFQRGIDVIGESLPVALAQSIRKYLRFHRRLPNLIAPTTFTEKQVLFKFFGPIPKPSPSDKLRSAGYLPRELREKVTIPQRPWISDQPGLPADDVLPDGVYYFKSNHSSGTNMPVALPASDQLRDEAAEISTEWLTKVHDEVRSLWWYESMPRNIYLEEDLSLGGGDAPDWKFFVANGRVELFQVDTGRHTHHIQTIYDRDGTFIQKELYFRSGDPVSIPDCLPTMIQVAEGIGRNFDFIRVDMFLRENQIYLGEITLVPNGATNKIRSAEIDAQLGAAWQCPWMGRVDPDWSNSHYSDVRYEPWD